MSFIHLRILLKIVFLSTSLIGFSQVGIGTTTPTAALEINSTSNLPALELNPQSNPVGTATGQIAVIGDQLFVYDATRSKWLTVESTVLSFGLENGVDNRFLEYVGDVTGTGAIMPYDGTIVYLSINTVGTNTSKSFQIFKNNVGVPNNDTVGMESIDGEVTTVNNVFQSTVHNINFNKGDSIRVFAAAAGATVQDPVVLLWVKWRRS